MKRSHGYGQTSGHNGANREVWNLDGDAHAWQMREAGGSAWLPARVPGNVALDLIAGGELPPWQHDANFRAFAEAAGKTWIYRLEFTLDELGRDPPIERTWRLVFQGIDTFGDIFLDGERLGTVRNLFRQHHIDLPTGFNPQAVHVVEVQIKPVLAEARAWAERMGVDLATLPKAFDLHERLAARKMQMVFGWDNTPHLLTGGIHGPVFLEAISGPVIEQLSWTVEEIDLDRKMASLCVIAETSGAEGNTYPLTLEIQGQCGDHTYSCFVPVDGTRMECRIPIEGAQFWWPNGMGPASLYETTVKLVGNGRLLDQQNLLIGLRTLELDTSEQAEIEVDYDIPSLHHEVMDGGMLGSWGRIPKPPRRVRPRNFRLLVNGEPVFARGANWQTPDVFPAAVSPEKRTFLLDAAAAAHMNMIRVWGGNAPEPEAFYEEAARRGLLIWQDFYFACGKYPEAEEFLEEVRAEVEELVRRLSRHTAIALWCGDNESDMIDVNRGDDPRANPINKGIIPQALQQYDIQNRPYHPSSPSGGPYPRSDWAGDRRDWGAWYPETHYMHIRQDEARFMSEGGCYAMPALPTFEKYISPENRWPMDNGILRLHTGDLDFTVRRFDRLNADLWNNFQPLRNYQEAVAVSQFAQAWGYKALIEHHRLRRTVCGGLLLWKLNDAWPALDAGLLDYDLQPRLSLDFVREAFRPVAVLTEQNDEHPDQLHVAVVNDTRQPAQGSLRLATLTQSASGAFDLQWNPEAIDVSVEPNSVLHLAPAANPGEGNLLLFELSLGNPSNPQRTLAGSHPATAWAWWRSLPDPSWPPTG